MQFLTAFIIIAVLAVTHANYTQKQKTSLNNHEDALEIIDLMDRKGLIDTNLIRDYVKNDYKSIPKHPFLRFLKHLGILDKIDIDKDGKLSAPPEVPKVLKKLQRMGVIDKVSLDDGYQHRENV